VAWRRVDGKRVRKMQKGKEIDRRQASKEVLRQGDGGTGPPRRAGGKKGKLLGVSCWILPQRNRTPK